MKKIVVFIDTNKLVKYQGNDKGNNLICEDYSELQINENIIEGFAPEQFDLIRSAYAR